MLPFLFPVETWAEDMRRVYWYVHTYPCIYLGRYVHIHSIREWQWVSREAFRNGNRRTTTRDGCHSVRAKHPVPMCPSGTAAEALFTKTWPTNAFRYPEAFSSRFSRCQGCLFAQWTTVVFTTPQLGNADRDRSVDTGGDMQVEPTVHWPLCPLSTLPEMNLVGPVCPGMALGSTAVPRKTLAQVECPSNVAPGKQAHELGYW
jgi:hypothetical protein